MDQSRDISNKRRLLSHLWSNLPQEIVFDIVSKLSYKPLRRFKLVSKSWLAFINNLILSGIRNKHLKIMITSGWRQSRFYTLDSLFPRNIVEIRCFFEENCFKIIGSCNGVILLRSENNFILWNPLTQKQRLIESPCNYKRIIIEGLSYDSVTKDFKVVIVVLSADKPYKPFRDSVYEKSFVYIFSSISSTWKIIDDFSYGSWGAQETVVVNDSPYWVMGRQGTPLVNVILYFDPREDRFRELLIPFSSWLHNHLKLTVLSGDLCAVHNDDISKTIDVWLVQDSSWHKLFVMPSKRAKSCCHGLPRVQGGYHRREFLPLCFVGNDGLNDEVVIQLDSTGLALFNLRTNKFARIRPPSDTDRFTLACYEETLASP